MDLCVRFGDARGNGEALLNHAECRGIETQDINLDHVIDRHAAYGPGEPDSN